MFDYNFFHIVFVLVFVTFFGIRGFYQRRSDQTRGGATYYEGEQHTLLRRLVGVPFMLLLLAYIIRPSVLGWAQLALPLWTQWLGVSLGIASLPLIWWVHQALGSNFSLTLHLRDEHTLVTSGPYQWVRHPMYTVLYIHLIAVLLLTQNWVIGGGFLLVLTVIVVRRLNQEEAVMLERFGDQYRTYMQHTGRLLPRLGP